MDRALRAQVLMAEAAQLGVTIDDLAVAAATLHLASSPVTVRTYVATIAPTFSPATAATYATYWRLAVAHFGDRRLAEVTVDDCAAVVAAAARRAREARPASDGRSSRENCVAALRALFSRAARSGLIAVNPAAAVAKPRRRPSRRRPLDHAELEELVDAIRTTSRDPDLDLLLVRFHLESGARREGALNLRRRDLDDRRATVWLREKFGDEREQPISPSLLRLLTGHADARGGLAGDDAVFRTRRGEAITRRRYNTIFDRARPCLPWSQRTPVSAHVLRYTAINAVGRRAGYAVAQAFAGHSPPSVTGLYLRARPSDVAAAVAILTGEPHPLAERDHGHQTESPRESVTRPAPACSDPTGLAPLCATTWCAGTSRRHDRRGLAHRYHRAPHARVQVVLLCDQG